MQLTFTPDNNPVNYVVHSPALIGYRLALWLPCAPHATMKLHFQVLFDVTSNVQHADHPGTAAACSPLTNGGPLPGFGVSGRLVVQNGPAGAAITINNISLSDSPPAVYGPNGEFLTQFVFFADGINNNIALGNPASARITSTNLPADNLANAGAQSCGLFQVSEGPGFVLGNLPHIPELPDLMPKPVLKGLDQSSRGLETSGMTVKFSTRRTQYNDLLTMLLRQMCADVPDLVLGFKRSNVGRFDDLTLNQSSLAGTLYEQMWGACNYLPVWTAADVQARQENLLAACDLDAVLNALGGRPLQMAGTINERVAFLLSHDLNWPPFPVLAP